MTRTTRIIVNITHFSQYLDISFTSFRLLVALDHKFNIDYNMKTVILLSLIFLESIPLNGLTYNEHLQFLQLQNAAYNMYLRTYAERKQKNNVFKSWYAATTEFPPLKSEFFENDTVVGDSQKNSAVVSMDLVYSRPRTVDDDIGMPLNQPIFTKEKTNFYNYGKLYQNYYQNGK
ncbi:hypothetical protein CRE_10807 [Caenorhabditis remanei]|uniref:Uncharacterized protein n=1 Tax=Caenorhabditis remanei TaxID=31234 RepID=E3M4Z3_CAERE|nr:hypothetical protein CRE_10807 [Caenorhabditis remanei]